MASPLNENARPFYCFTKMSPVLPDNALGREHRDAKIQAHFPKQLASLLEEIQQKLQFLYLGEAISKLRSGKALDRSYVVLTFDEGFESSINAALPILEDLNIPATFFICSNHLDETNNVMWDQEVHAITASLSPNPIALSWMDRQLPTYPASNAAQSAKDLLRHLLQLDPQKREQRITDLRALVATEVRPSILDRHVSQYELNQYAKHTLLSFGAHGHTHQPLLTLDQTALEQELRLCREIIASVCGQIYIDVLNFPFGNQNQISPGLLQSKMAEGFIAALYDGDGVARPGDHFTRFRVYFSRNSNLRDP